MSSDQKLPQTSSRYICQEVRKKISALWDPNSAVARPNNIMEINNVLVSNPLINKTGSLPPDHGLNTEILAYWALRQHRLSLIALQCGFHNWCRLSGFNQIFTFKYQAGFLKPELVFCKLNANASRYLHSSLAVSGLGPCPHSLE